MRSLLLLTFLGALCAICSCNQSPKEKDKPHSESEEVSTTDLESTYTRVRLTTDLSKLSDNEKQVIPLLIDAAEMMNGLFWYESYGDKEKLISGISNPQLKDYVEVNYGPWDRLDNNKPFIEGIGEKPLGANFYPSDMSKDEFEKWADPNKTSLYTLIRRDDSGKLKSIWYHQHFADELQKVCAKLREAAALTDDPSFQYFLELRAEALETDRYKPSDIAWLNLKNNSLDIIIGPIENYEDQLFSYKAAHEAYVLVKDKEWSEKLERFAELLPSLQEGLPVADKYKQDPVGRNAQLNAYDVIYYAGDCNAGSKTIAVNLPNDEDLQMNHGTRRSQLKNAMKAKYEKILIPIANELIDTAQLKHISFEAFFGNTMFHEVAHGLGIKQTINGKGTVREALLDQASALEEGKADILGLYMVSKLFEMGEIEEGLIMDNYVTFMASIFRSVRFGAASAHGKANMLRFNYFLEQKAFSRDANGKYSVNFEAMQSAMNGLSALIIQLQGDGDYEGVKKLMSEKGSIGETLQFDLDRLDAAGIPVDVVFEQGTDVLGL